MVSYKLKNTLSDFGSVSRGVCKVKNSKLTSINEHLKIEKSDGIIKDFESGNILDKDDYVSMNFWLCRSNFFNHLDSYIKETMEKLSNIEKDEIYLPFAAQKLLTERIFLALYSHSYWITSVSTSLKASIRLSKFETGNKRFEDSGMTT